MLHKFYQQVPVKFIKIVQKVLIVIKYESIII
jgi:hypothetical protein